MSPAPTELAAASPEVAAQWSPAVRRIISGLLLLHLTALVAGPASVAPSSLLSQSLWHAYRPYLDLAYLNHGYHFFAPEPGPSHLIRYEAELPDGRRRLGYFPDLKQHRPRLLYHRHFMLSEHLANLAADAPQDVVAVYSASFARHLLKEHAATSIKLYLVRHDLPAAAAVQAGMALDDASLYRERLLGEFKAGES